MIDLKEQDTKQSWKERVSVASLPKRKTDVTRVVLHLSFWAWDCFMAVYALKRIIRVTPSQPPDPDLFNLMLGWHLGTTIVLFYLYGYLVVPSLLVVLVSYTRERALTLWQFIRLYKSRLLYVIGATMAIVIFFNIYDYYLFNYARTHYFPVPDYIKRNSDLFTRTGPLGIFSADTITVQTFLWAYNISYLLLPVLLRIIRYAILWGNESIMQKEKNEQLIQNQLDALKYQISPHFLFNLFNNIYAMIHRTNKQAADLLRKLTQLMKYTIYETGQKFVPLASELDFLRNYVDIERIRHFKAENIQYNQTGEADGFMIPPLLLITFVENAFKHGINNSFDEGWVRIDIIIDALHKKLIVEIANNIGTDDTTGFDQNLSGPNKAGGVGLANARQRLNLLFDPSLYTIQVTQTANFYQVNLTFPLKKSSIHESQETNSVPNY